VNLRQLAALLSFRLDQVLSNVLVRWKVEERIQWRLTAEDLPILLKVLIGLEEPTSGIIRFRGEDISEFDKRERKNYLRNVQMIFCNCFRTWKAP
jgi:ABC-type polar amino acid transport system ATPase subunit